MGTLLRGLQVSRIESLYGTDVEQILRKHEEEGAALNWVAKKYRVHPQTLYAWRRKLEFPKRRKVHKK